MAPKVHTIKKPSQSTSAEPEVTVANAVTLDNLDEENTPTTQAASVVPQPTTTTATEADFSEDEDEEDVTVVDNLLGQDDEDEDLSLLVDEEGPSLDSVGEAQEEPEEGFLEVFREECLSCRELVPFAKKSFKRKGCHFTSGNKNCPAESTTIVIRVPLEDIVPRFRTAEKERNFSRLAKLSAHLATKPEWYQQRVAQALDKARQNDKS